MNNSFLYYDPVIIRSLKKSSVRLKILSYLYKIYPAASYPNEIARKTSIGASNVLGGLRGMGNRYNGNSSLIEMGLVEVIDNNGDNFYKLSEMGKKIQDHICAEDCL